ncbi:MAG: FAD binding domain-containing protein, partial [Acidimicrobiales bacterium]
LGTDPTICSRHPALAEAAATVGGWQTQAVGTLGGNICNASPAADTAPPLLVADSVLELTSSAGRRSVPVEEFFLGRRKIDRRPDELVTAVVLRPIGPGAGEAYLKVGRRGAMVVAVAGLAARLLFGKDGRIEDARVALCSVAPTPLRLREVEKVLVGSVGSEAVVEAGAVLAAAVAPIDDARASGSYRRAVLAGLLERAVGLCRSRAGVEEQR